MRDKDFDIFPDTTLGKVTLDLSTLKDGTPHDLQLPFDHGTLYITLNMNNVAVNF